MRSFAKRAFFTLVVAVLTISISISTLAKTDSAQVILLERDTIQTRNYQPIINHEILAGNCTDTPLKMDVASVIPNGKDVSGDFYPAFGYDSALGVPMQSPWVVDINKYRLFTDVPVHRKANGTIPAAFVWSKIPIGAKEAVTFQYDNFYGSKGMFYKRDGTNIEGLEITARYLAAPNKKGPNSSTVTISYVLANKTDHDILDLTFRIYVPDSIVSSDGKTPLVEEAAPTGPSFMEIGQSVIADGLGRLTSGYDFFLKPRTLKKNENLKLTIRLNWVPILEGEIHPTIYVQGRGEGRRLWPSTTVEVNPRKELTRFYYRMWNIVLPDRYYFVVKPKAQIVIKKR